MFFFLLRSRLPLLIMTWYIVAKLKHEISLIRCVFCPHKHCLLCLPPPVCPPVPILSTNRDRQRRCRGRPREYPRPLAANFCCCRPQCLSEVSGTGFDVFRSFFVAGASRSPVIYVLVVRVAVYSRRPSEGCTAPATQHKFLRSRPRQRFSPLFLQPG